MEYRNLEQVSVLIIGYSRISHIRNSINRLRTFGVENIFLALDYSDDLKVRSEQQELVSELSLWKMGSSKPVVVWHKTRNHGIGAGVISALDWFFHYNIEGIILEDDLLFDEGFLDFCARALEKYRNEKEVLMVSGDRFNASLNGGRVAATNYPQIWGWATWRDKRFEIRNLITSEKKIRFRDLIKPNVCFFYAGARRVQIGIIDTWDLPLSYEMITRQKICVLPDVNLVRNIGADKHAIHTTEIRFPMNFPIAKSSITQLPSLEEIESSIVESNVFLENKVFKIRSKHILSPLKLWLQTLWSPRKPRKTLSQRLRESEKSHE